MKKYILNSCLLFVMLLLSINTAHTTDTLLVHLQNGTTQSVPFEDIQNLSFTDGDLSVKIFGGNTIFHSLNNIEKITFCIDDIITDVEETQYATSLPNIVIYYALSGEIVVESPIDIQSLTLFNLDGKVLHKTISTTIFVSSLPAGVYFLKIETMQGSIVKKIIKN